jgi:hypothetical protein
MKIISIFIAQHYGAGKKAGVIANITLGIPIRGIKYDKL